MDGPGNASSQRLAGIYLRAFLWVLFAVWLLWQIGLESIDGHPTPFYALYSPVKAAGPLFWATGLQALLLGCGWAVYRRAISGDTAPRRREVWRTLAGLAAFAFAYAAAVAAMRGGLDGFSQAYSRQAYEYIGDIGLGGSIRGLFRDYNAIHPYLSMHAKVHPPGPVAILWVLSFVAGREPLALSLATMAVGATAVVPLYWWVRDMFDHATGVTACMVYVLMPSIALFTATSADILFMPLTITSLFLFWRAITRGTAVYALAAGAVYALMSLMSFSLIGVGAFFGFIGLWKLRDPASRFAVVKTAVLMALSLAAVHAAIYWWSGFDAIECFRLAKQQFDLDQHHLDLYSPRWPSWTWKFLNPLSMAYFAGIPVTVLALSRLRRPGSGPRPLFLVVALTLATLDILYLARGEGERSAMYVLPFAAVLAAHRLEEIRRAAGSPAPAAVTATFLAFQCWFTEAVFYTYW